jgi:hypothetical protein
LRRHFQVPSVSVASVAMYYFPKISAAALASGPAGMAAHTLQWLFPIL